MGTVDFINDIGGIINARILEEAEPLIKEAMEDIEKRLRMVVHQSIVENITTSYNVVDNMQGIVITIRKPNGL